jgi:hypothetical protein
MFGNPIIAPPAPPGNRSGYNPGLPKDVIYLKLGGSLIADKSRA